VEKLIPKSIKFLSLNRKIDLHDNGNPSRVWLHAGDTARAVIHIIDQGVTGEIYNISGNAEMPNREVIKKILSYYFDVDHDHDWESFVTPSSRQGQDVRYAINDSKLKQLGWTATADFDQELAQVVKHYRNNFVW
jgi:dTDP-glucose 4,6-dehydratase